jgi:predicted Zn-dependent protease
MALWKSLLESPPVRWCLSNRWRLRLVILILFTGVILGSALLLRARERRTAHDQLLADAWRQFDWAVDADDYTTAEDLLTRLADFTQDPAVRSRLAVLHGGEADAGDAALARLLMNEHLRHNRWPEATREAAKVVAATPSQMLARGLLARQELRDGHADAARAHLAAIPSPFENSAGAMPGALLLVVNLKRELGDDDADLLAFIALRVVPMLKSRKVDQFSDTDALQLLQCYHLACSALERYPALAEFWVPGAKLLARLGDDPQRTTAVALVREAHLAIVYRLRQTNALPAKESESLIAEFEAQVAAEWATARSRDERDPRPYVGLALAAYRRRDLAGAKEWLERGLKACDHPRDLYLVLGRLLRDSDPLTAAVFLEEAYERFPKDAAVGMMLAELALAAGRPDRARQVCRAARAANPTERWARRIEAASSLALEQPTQALEALAPIRATLKHDATGMELYARAACAVGAEALADELLAPPPISAAEAEGYLGAARGYLAASRPAEAVRCAKVIVTRFPEHRPARIIQAESLNLLAQANDAVKWPAEPVREALDAFDWLRQRDPGNRHVAQRIAWLQLKGLNSPALALRSAAPLREEGAVLTVEMTETLAAVLVANGEAEPALRLFDDVVKRAPSRAGAYIGRAEAALRLGRRGDAADDLRRAGSLSRTPRQTAEWQRIDRELRGER